MWVSRFGAIMPTVRCVETIVRCTSHNRDECFTFYATSVLGTGGDTYFE